MARTHSERQFDNRPQPKPYGDALALVPNKDPDKEARTLELGAVWLSEKGNLTLTLELWPLAWDDPSMRRTIVIKKRDVPK
jgi:hypothetical protein